MDHRRRKFLQGVSGSGAYALALGLGLGSPGFAVASSSPGAVEIHRRHIPSSGEALPVIGLGSWITFDNPPADTARQTSQQIIDQFLAAGGTMIDSSPMYGYAQEVIGESLRTIPQAESAFSATKVWIPRASLGEGQMNQALELWGLRAFDLVYVHNLVDWQGHLPWMRRWKDEGKLHYLGVSTSHGRRHEEMASIIREQTIDFVQFTYNIVDREAELELLPLAREQGKAVVINRPFRGGDLFRRVQAKPLPPGVTDLGYTSWAQYFLAWVVSHPDVCCAIPATSNPQHLRENMAVLRMPLANEQQRQQMRVWFEQL